MMGKAKRKYFYCLLY